MELKTSLRDFLQVLFYRKNVILTLFVTVVVGSFVATMLVTPIFEASTTILIEKEPNLPWVAQSNQQINAPALLSLTQESAEVARTQSEIVTSRVVLRKALERLKMVSADERVIEARVAQLQQSILVTPVKETTDLIQIKVHDANPQSASDLANAIAQSYVSWYIDRRKGKASSTLAYLDKQLRSLGKGLDQFEGELASLKEEGGLVSVGEQVRSALARLSEFEGERKKILSDEEEFQTKLNKIRSELKNPSANVLAAQSKQNPQVDALRRKLVDMELQLASLKATYRDDSSPVLKLQQEVEAARDLLNKELLVDATPEFSGDNPIYQDLVRKEVSLEVDLEALGIRKRHIEESLEEYRAQVTDLAEKQKEYDRLMREISSKENMYSLLKNRREEAVAAESIKEEGITTVKVLDPAVPPQRPIWPNKLLNLVMGCFVGVLSGIGGASLFEYFDHSFKQVDEVEQVLGLPVLGSIPKGPGKLKEIDVIESQSPLAESYLTLRTNIQRLSRAKSMQTLLVASPARGDGRTQTVANLAVLLSAIEGNKTLLIDGDLRHPRLHTLFEIKDEPGLAEFLQGKANLQEIIYPTRIKNLKMIPSGRSPKGATELFHSSLVTEMINTLKKEYDSLLFDSPPVIPYTDPVILSGHVDGIVLLVKARETRREVARRTRDLLNKSQDKILGVVFNSVEYVIPQPLYQKL